MGVMKHPGLFDFVRRMDDLQEKGDPLVRLNEIIPWEEFRPLLRRVVKKEEGAAGRPAYDVVLMFKILVLQRLYDLSDAQMEYQVKDRLTFMRFLEFDFLTDVPDEKTIWNFREKLKEKGLARKLFQRFNRLLEEHGYISKPV